MGVNDFPFDDESGEDSPELGDNPNFKQLRTYARNLEKERKALREENANLRAEVTKSVFKEVGLSEKHAALFARVHEGELTKEAVESFATEYELPRRQVEQSTETPAQETPATEEATQTQEVQAGQIVDLNTGEQRPADTGFAPTAVGNTPAGTIITDTAEAQRIAIENPAEYMRLKEAGRIKLASLPGNA